MHLHMYMCTNTHTVCFDSWDEGETSLTNFICLCLSNSLSSLPWMALFGAFTTRPSHLSHQEWCFPYCDHKGYHLPSHPSSCGTSPQCCCTQELLCHSSAISSAHSLGWESSFTWHQHLSSAPGISPTAAAREVLTPSLKSWVYPLLL